MKYSLLRGTGLLWSSVSDPLMTVCCGIILKSLQQCRQALKIRHWLFRYVEQFASGKGLLSYICAAEAFNKGMTRDRRQECHYFGHLHPFPNLVREPKHGNEEVPISDDLR